MTTSGKIRATTFHSGMKHLAQGDIHSGVRLLTRLCDDPEFGARAGYAVAFVHWRAGRSAEAIEACAASLEKDGCSTRALALMAELQLAAGRQREAHSISRQILELEHPPFDALRARRLPLVAVISGLGHGSVRIGHDGQPYVSGGNNNFADLIDPNRFSPFLVWAIPGTDPAVFRDRVNEADIVFNAMSEADSQAEELQWLIEAGLTRRIINPPVAIMATSRQAIAAAAQELDGVLVPECMSVTEEMHQDRFNWAAQRLPVLFRPYGSHGGDSLTLLYDEDQLKTALTDIKHGYLTAFVDFAGPDGYYRKLRVYCIGGKVLPEHYYLGASWNVHARDSRLLMRRHKWMDEEANRALHSFDPDGSITKFVRALGARLELDMFIVDMGMREGNEPVFFEANASAAAIRSDDLPDEGRHVVPFVGNIGSAFNDFLASVLLTNPQRLGAAHDPSS